MKIATTSHLLSDDVVTGGRAGQPVNLAITNHNDYSFTPEIVF